MIMVAKLALTLMNTWTYINWNISFFLYEIVYKSFCSWRFRLFSREDWIWKNIWSFEFSRPFLMQTRNHFQVTEKKETARDFICVGKKGHLKRVTKWRRPTTYARERKKEFIYNKKPNTHLMYFSYRNIKLSKVKLLHSSSVVDVTNCEGFLLCDFFSEKTNIVTYNTIHRSYFQWLSEIMIHRK
jgi:hypothetical protein